MTEMKKNSIRLNITATASISAALCAFWLTWQFAVLKTQLFARVENAVQVDDFRDWQDDTVKLSPTWHAANMREIHKKNAEPMPSISMSMGEHR